MSKKAICSPAANAKGATRMRDGKNRAAIQLIETWLTDESGYDEETWPSLKDSLEANRQCGRRLFRG